ncbi:transcription initiation protein [Chitinophaga sp. Mgbs1]|uniref:Transcription initiation protein n=1 Tax=Chitinophaga solisilvae TaxID=1233460 RepID=A0A433WKZ9_9BACT|nr:transcription initiation protein [Chitinophaga solisilvae]
MKEFMMLFRHIPASGVQQTPEAMQACRYRWQDWIGGIAAQDKFVSTNKLGNQGKTVSANQVITDGPYAAIKEIISGYIIVRADSLEEAVALSAGCPILDAGGHVEIRNIIRYH